MLSLEIGQKIRSMYFSQVYARLVLRSFREFFSQSLSETSHLTVVFGSFVSCGRPTGLYDRNSTDDRKPYHRQCRSLDNRRAGRKLGWISASFSQSFFFSAWSKRALRRGLIFYDIVSVFFGELRKLQEHRATEFIHFHARWNKHGISNVVIIHPRLRATWKPLYSTWHCITIDHDRNAGFMRVAEPVVIHLITFSFFYRR